MNPKRSLFVCARNYKMFLCAARLVLLTLTLWLNGYSQGEVQVANERRITVGEARQIVTEKSVSTEALRIIPQRDIRELQLELQHRDLPLERALFRAHQLRDENGVIPVNALPKALQQLDSLRVRAEEIGVLKLAGVPVGREVQPENLLPPTAGLNQNHSGWLSLGPNNVGGRTRSILIHPTNPNIIWVGSVGGGIWRSQNGGTSYTAVNDLMANMAISCMVLDPSNPRIIYAGTGESFGNSGALRGAGIFMTTDGATWKQLSATTGEDFQFVNSLAISSDGRVLLVATTNGIFRSVDNERLTWTRMLPVNILLVAFNPSDNTKLVASGPEGDAYYSTDAGVTWVRATHANVWAGRAALAYAKKDPSIVYASVDNNFGEIWRSNDGGKTYVRRNSRRPDGKITNYLGNQGWYDNAIWAGDPTNSNLVIIGGIDLWRSVDGGDTLVDISTWWDPRSAHSDHHVIVSHPAYDGVSNKTVYFGNDGGIFKTTDVTTVGNDAVLPRISGWSKLNSTYGVTQFYYGAGNVATGTIIGGAQDNGTLRFTTAGGESAWTEMFGGDGGACAADPNDPKIFYGEYVDLNIHRSIDGGAKSEFISGQWYNPNKFGLNKGGFDWKSAPYLIPDAKSGETNFIAPFVLDPNNSDRILAGGASLWRTNDAKTPTTPFDGPEWTSIKNSVDSQALPISAIAIAKNNSDVVWVGHNRGRVYMTSNGTQANPDWRRVDRNGEKPLPEGRDCLSVTIDPRDNKVVYVTFGGFARGNVWKTIDGGLNWTDISSSLPEAPIRTLVIHPQNSKFIYIGTEVGVFASENGGADWSPTNEGPTSCSVDHLFWMRNTLIAVTHGRGMFKIDLTLLPN
jgi:photosystem II stability/assembly factor-like uncharacterized protein